MGWVCCGGVLISTWGGCAVGGVLISTWGGCVVGMGVHVVFVYVHGCG